jgi:hypothetical protein
MRLQCLSHFEVSYSCICKLHDTLRVSTPHGHFGILHQILDIWDDILREDRSIGGCNNCHEHELNFQLHQLQVGEQSMANQERRRPTTCISVRRAADRTVAASSRRRSTMYGTMRSSFASSVRWQERARNTSSARTLELGSEQFRTLAVTRAKMMSAGPSEVVNSSAKWQGDSKM